jgi:hypothetical protein
MLSYSTYAEICGKDVKTVQSFRLLESISGKKVGTGVVVCFAKESLPLADDIWILPVTYL